MLNILIACDHQLYRESLLRTLNAEPLFHVVGSCADTHAAIAVTCNEQPDIVFIDGSSDPLAAIQATKKIISCSTANVIAISRKADPVFAQHMLAAGALGYLTSQSSCIEIIAAVEEVAKDNLYCCLDNKNICLPTPDRFSSFKKSIAVAKDNARQKIGQAVENHWHGILKFTN